MLIDQLHDDLMLRAIRLAEKGMNSTTPNPRVGCVIVSPEGDIVGEGYHLRAGEAHAEVNALTQAGELARGATAYVTLEPCSHQGKTGPCAEALIAAGVAKLVYGMEDPNPLVSGRGLEKLEDAGIEVIGPVQELAAIELNPGFIKRMRLKRPFIRIKMAMSLDGRTAMASGESKWITGPAARQDVQKMRARSCAIVTGVESVIHDDPALTVRLDADSRQPLRVIVDSKGRCPQKADILAQAGTTVIACDEDLEPGLREADPSARVYWPMPMRKDRVDLVALVNRLAAEGCNEILVESGATLAGAFIARGLVDEIVVYMAAKLMGSEARPLFDLPIGKMSSLLSLSISDVRAVGPDWRITAVPDPEG